MLDAAAAAAPTAAGAWAWACPALLEEEQAAVALALAMEITMSWAWESAAEHSTMAEPVKVEELAPVAEPLAVLMTTSLEAAELNEARQRHLHRLQRKRMPESLSAADLLASASAAAAASHSTTAKK